MLELLRSLRRNRRLLKDFVVRDLKARYVGSSMGFFWSIVFPIINLAVYMFVFRLVLNTRWADGQGPGSVALVMLAGIVVWAAFAETISRSTNTLVDNANLIQKVVFPSELLPVYLALSSLINMCIGILVTIPCVAWFAYVSPEVETASLGQVIVPDAPKVARLGLGLPLVSLPLLFALQITFTIGLGSFLATLNLFVRDTFHLVGVFITVWMFTTPIFYPALMVESAGFGWMLRVNPMYWLIESYREVMLYARWPDPALLGRFALVAVIVFGLGTQFFMAQKRRFPDLL